MAISEAPQFVLPDVVDLTRGVRDVAVRRPSMADAAQAIVEFLRDELDRPEVQTTLIRLYATIRTRALPPELNAETAGRDGSITPSTPCLTLLGTAGREAAWSDRRRSSGHRAIPLVDPRAVADQIPMVAGLMDQLGVDVGDVIDLREDNATVLHHREFGIFHVAQARGSRLIPAQDFVAQHGVESVVGCGGGLPSGEVFALVVFSSCSIDAACAEQFSTLAYGLKAALVPYTYRVF